MSSRPVKLRDSCDACAISKVKCHREKPTCSRCLRRGVACKYVVTRRGKKYGSSTTSGDDVSPHHPATNDPIQPLGAVHSLSETGLSTDVVRTGTLEYNAATPLSSDLNFACFTSPPNLSPASQSLFPPIADVITSLGGFDIPFPDAETSGTGIFDDALLFGPFPVREPSAAPNTVNNEAPPTITSRSQTAATTSSPDEESPCCQASLSADMSHNCCLEHALGLMHTLIPTNKTWRNGASPTVEDTIDKNRQVLGAISLIMQCTCSDGGYLLAIISLIIYKVLGGYDNALRNMPVSNINTSRKTSSTTASRPKTSSSIKSQENLACLAIDKDCFCGEDQYRMKAQLVLGELHRVQSLINMLSPKLKYLASRRQESLARIGGSGGVKEMPSISALVIDQVRIDLKSRLQWLSKHIIARLNQE
ncbi:hypothetical protein EKO27_g6850 [Xylaria grammica]|uniref:Zn(2)-C6 fungal-type domain-containing protein n=1 Tax=Xylaria grammica TaxID=363999 RepID=A0A439D1H0_9PEZI|nr:hypothetical protein EKO27_g6850 [Xylaria grammica]